VLTCICGPQPLTTFLAAARAALRPGGLGRVVCFLPRNTDLRQLSETVDVASGECCEVERNLLDGRFKGVTAYYQAAR
jgi:RNA cap guanine-N2 methyltransferase